MNYYNEYDKKAAAGLRQLIAEGLIPAGEVDERSIVDVKAADLKGFTQHHFFAGIGGWSLALQLAGWSADRPVFTGSCPCQPFSAAGKGEGGKDHRNLWPVWFDLIRELRPAVCYGEQVSSAIPHGWLDRVFADMEGESYAVGSAVLPACSVDAPHKRDRLWYVAKSGVGLADTSGEQTQRVRPSGLQPEPAQCSAGVGPVANASTAGFPQRRGGTMGERGTESQSKRLCEAGGGALDNPERNRRQERRHDNAGNVGNISDATGERLQGVAQGDTFKPRLEGLSGHGNEGDQPGWDGEEPNRPVSPAGFWDDHDWITCADGKARRIPSAKSGIRLLVNGFSERVGLLSTAGNAIVPEVAARFIQATM